MPSKEVGQTLLFMFVMIIVLIASIRVYVIDSEGSLPLSIRHSLSGRQRRSPSGGSRAISEIPL